MKRNLFAMCLVAALACAGTASADVLAEDSAANYTAETFVDGANLGSGFGAWEFWNAWPTLADSTAGLCGDINSGNDLSFRFARDGGADYCNGYRGFDALKAGDTLTFRFTCAYCGGGRGLDLFANGGHSDADKIANVIHLSGDNEFSVNGTVISTDWAPNTVTTVNVIQEADGIKIALARVPAEEGGAGNVTYWTKVETDKKLTGIGIYAGGWDWNDGADVENYAFYVNDLKIEGTPPSDKLSLSGPWAVTNRDPEELTFTLTRTKSEGTLDVALESSYSKFVSVPGMVTFADGDTEVKFTATATIQGNENTATISATAEGVSGATFGLKGPKYTCTAWEDGVENPKVLNVGGTRDFYIDNCWKEGWAEADNTRITAIRSTDQTVLQITSIGEWQEGDKGSYSKCKVSGVGPGEATVEVYYSGKMCECDFTVRALGFAISGPTNAVAEKPYTYTLSVVTANTSEPAVISVTGDATVTPDSAEVYPETPVSLSVTFNTPGDFTLSVATPEGELAFDLPVTVTEAPDYSKYIAYDDASLYADGFDTAALGEGTEKFQAWKILQDDNNPDGGIYCGSYIDSEGKFPSALYSDGTAFGLYANGSESANYVLYRPFVHSLAPGQTFSADWAPSTGDYGSRYFRLVREWDNNQYARFELYSGSGYLGYNLAGVTSEGTDLGWEPANRVVHIELALSADGGTYSIALSDDQGNEWSTSFPSSTGEWGDGIQGVVIGTWNSPNDSGFNKLAIEQVVAPKARIWLSGNNNPDGPGDIVFTLGANTTEIGVVALSVSEGASVSPESIDLTGLTEATFTVTLATAEPESKFTVTATPEDTTIDPYSFDIYPIAPWLELKSKDDRWHFYTYDKEIWLYVKASPANYGTYPLAISGDEGVLELSTDSVTVPNPEDENGWAWFNVFIKGEGRASVYLADFAPDAEGKSWGFTVEKSSVVVLPSFEVVTTEKGRGLAWKAADLTGAALVGTDSLLGEVVWSDLVENEDYIFVGEGEDAKLVVLFNGKFFAGKNVGFVTTK